MKPETFLKSWKANKNHFRPNKEHTCALQRIFGDTNTGHSLYGFFHSQVQYRVRFYPSQHDFRDFSPASAIFLVIRPSLIMPRKLVGSSFSHMLVKT
jgi:hypothetical protein